MEKYTVVQAIAFALMEAERKLRAGLLIKSKDWTEDMRSFEFTEGDPETIYTILALYSQELENNEDKYRLEKALCEKYPEYK